MGFDVLHQKITNGMWKSAYKWVRSEDGPRMASMDFCGDLPIHMACRSDSEGGAPPQLIHALIRAYPQGVSTKGNGGSLPLHIAMERKLSYEVIVALILAHPDGLDGKDDSDRTPRDFLSKNADSVIVSIMNRPTSCWKVATQHEQSLVKKEEEIAKLQQQLVEVKSKIAKQEKNLEALAGIFKTLLPRVQENAGKRSNTMKQSLERIATLRADVGEFILDVNKRLARLDEALQKRHNRWYTFRAADLKEQIEWSNTYKEIAESIDSLRIQTDALKVSTDKYLSRADILRV